MVESQYSATTTPFEKLNRKKLESMLEAMEQMTPAYVYDEEYLVNRIDALKQAFRPPGSDIDCNIRYAMKAQSNANILKIFGREGIQFDCSSIFEVKRVMDAGIDPATIELASQELT